MKDENWQTYGICKGKMQNHVMPWSNFRLARHQLRGCTQAPTESVDAFFRRLHTIAAVCEYPNVNEQLIDALIFGTKSKEVQKNLLKKSKTLIATGNRKCTYRGGHTSAIGRAAES